MITGTGEQAREAISDISEELLGVNRATWDCILVNKIVLKMGSFPYV